MATSNFISSRSEDGRVLTCLNNKGAAKKRDEILSVLDCMNVLTDEKLCLQVIAELAEKIGYQCAGKAGTTTVAELMLMSERASKLAERVG